jgi:hypothetical protein
MVASLHSVQRKKQKTCFIHFWFWLEETIMSATQSPLTRFKEGLVANRLLFYVWVGYAVGVFLFYIALAVGPNSYYWAEYVEANTDRTTRSLVGASRSTLASAGTLSLPFLMLNFTVVYAIITSPLAWVLVSAYMIYLHNSESMERAYKVCIFLIFPISVVECFVDPMQHLRIYIAPKRHSDFRCVSTVELDTSLALFDDFVLGYSRRFEYVLVWLIFVLQKKIADIPFLGDVFRSEQSIRW